MLTLETGLALLLARSHLEVTTELLAGLVLTAGALVLVDSLAALLGGVAALAIVGHEKGLQVVI